MFFRNLIKCPAILALLFMAGVAFPSNAEEAVKKEPTNDEKVVDKKPNQSWERG
jgi:hypothetical protein